MFGLSLIGYLCLPDMIRMWRNDCTFMSITDKQVVSIGFNSVNLYSLEGNFHVWDRISYNPGDLVCVKKQI